MTAAEVSTEPRQETPPAVRRRRSERVVGLLTGAFVGIGVLMVALRAIPELQRHWFGPYVSAFIPYGILAWGAAFLLSLLLPARATRVLVVGCAAGLLLQASWVAPLFVADERPPGGTAVTIASWNIRDLAVDPDVLTRRTSAADIVILLEFDRGTEAILGQGTARALQERGWQERYPHTVAGIPGPGASTVIYSRFPLEEVESLPSIHRQFVVRVSPPSGPPFVLVAAHPLNPRAGSATWEREGTLLADAVARHSGGPLVVMGDLNGTTDQLTIRRLLAAAPLRDAADEAGAGWLRTWPNHTVLDLPPLIALDHAFVGGSAYADAVETLAAAGSDHRGLLLRLRVR
ncbi:MAG: endonuclease/exonuclease/phosphatase family protein [Tetrasphaera sp.]